MVEGKPIEEGCCFLGQFLLDIEHRCWRPLILYRYFARSAKKYLSHRVKYSIRADYFSKNEKTYWKNGNRWK